MTNVCFAGVTGWTAPPILTAVHDATDLDLVAGVSRSAAGRTLAEVTGIAAPGQVYGTVTEALQAAPPGNSPRPWHRSGHRGPPCRLRTCTDRCRRAVQK